jgi:hypothetical protein
MNGNVRLAGEVSNFQARANEPHRLLPMTIWTFVLERFDEQGNRLAPVPVEMRALGFEGFIRDGDRVEIHGKWKQGEIFRPKEVRNLSTNSKVKRKMTFW